MKYTYFVSYIVLAHDGSNHTNTTLYANVEITTGFRITSRSQINEIANKIKDSYPECDSVAITGYSLLSEDE